MQVGKMGLAGAATTPELRACGDPVNLKRAVYVADGYRNSACGFAS